MARTSSSPDGEAPRTRRFERFRQVALAFRQARELDPSVVWWMLGALVLVLAVAFGIGLAVDHPLYAGFLGLLLGALAAGVVMVRRTERAAYGRLEGQPGAGGAALGALRRGWMVEQEPVAVEAARPGDLSAAALVFRAVGRPGVVLVAEGPAGRAQRLADGERKRLARVLPNVPVTVLRLGTGPDEVPVRKLVGRLNRMRPSLTKTEVTAVHKRLRSLGSGRPPVPKGIDPMRARPDRRGMRGR